MSQQIDKRIINKIHQLVGDGMRNIIEMQRPLGVLRWNSLILSKSLLEIVNAYPEERGICNHMYNAAPKLRMSKVD